MANYDSYLEISKKFQDLIEMTLSHHQMNYTSGSQISIADFVLASYFSNFLNNPLSLVNKRCEWIDKTSKLQTYIIEIIGKHFIDMPQTRALVQRISESNPMRSPASSPIIQAAIDNLKSSGDVCFEYQPDMKVGDPLSLLFDYIG